MSSVLVMLSTLIFPMVMSLMCIVLGERAVLVEKVMQFYLLPQKKLAFCVLLKKLPKVRLHH